MSATQKFYELEVGDKFTLPDQQEVLTKSGDDTATSDLVDYELLVNPDDFILKTS